MLNKVLIVDDEPAVLTAFMIRLSSRFDIQTATSAEQGLEVVEEKGPFAVVLSDMRMPGMNGIEFLKCVQERTPDTVRMLFTGHAALDTAIQAINEGRIFRFITKPCDPDMLAVALDAGLEQYQLVTAERELLEKTLNASIRVLTDILSLIHPIAFSRTGRIERYVRHITETLNVPNPWQYKLAAMLSQLGSVILPSSTLENIYAGTDLSESEEQSYTEYPAVGARFLEKIPRLGEIARMIEKQQEPFSESDQTVNPLERDAVSFGSQVLRASMDFDNMLTHGEDHETAIRRMKIKKDLYCPVIVKALSTAHSDMDQMEMKYVTLKELEASMVFAADVRAKNGSLVVVRDQEVTYSVLSRLRNWSGSHGIEEPLAVLVPRQEEEAIVDS